MKMNGMEWNVFKAAFVLAEKDFRKSFYTNLCVW